MARVVDYESIDESSNLSRHILIMIHFFNFSLLLTFALLSVLSLNPIHCILNLIGLFTTTTIFIVILKLMFIGLVFLAVYLGAIAILFLFIVMMIDIKVTNDHNVYLRYWKFFDFTFLFFIIILYYVDNNYLDILNIIKFNINFLINNDINLTSSTYVDYFAYEQLYTQSSFLYEFSNFLFTKQIVPFLECGFILFIGMVGAIVLTVEPINHKFLFQQDPGLQSNYKRSINLI